MVANPIEEEAKSCSNEGLPPIALPLESVPSIKPASLAHSSKAPRH